MKIGKAHKFLIVFAALLLACLPLYAQLTFIENKGQWEPQVKYRAEILGGLLFVENGSLTFLLAEAAPFREMHNKGVYNKPVKMHSYKVKFSGSNDKISFLPEQKVITEYNYFIGNNPSKWATGVNGYNKITLKNLYNGIDLEIFGSANNTIKYNLIVQPGANPTKIQMVYEGLDGLELEKGQLHLKTSVGEIHEYIPLAYQMDGDELVKVKTEYKLKDNVLSFDITEKYNRRKQFVIDPILVFSTYSGSLADNWGFTATWDNFGNAYGGGTVYNFGYPITTGAFQSNFAGGVGTLPSVGDLARDAAIYKVSSNGSTLLFATYLGGNHNEQPHSMVVNSQGNLVILGTTFSANFPTSTSAFDRTLGGQSDIYVFVLSGSGRSMLASSFIGGTNRDGLNGRVFDPNQPNESPIAYNYGDQFRGEVIVDKRDNIYIATCTQSSAADGFPLVTPFQNSFGGIQDGCVLKLNDDASAVLWSSYIGGNGWDAAYGLDLDGNGNLFVAGGSTAGIPQVAAGTGVVTNFSGGRSDAYLLKINPQGVISNATYMGTVEYDQAYFVKVDKFDNPYITGQTAGIWPVKGNTYTTPNGGQFITKFTPNLSDYTLSMVFGNGTVRPQISPSAFLVDECERIFVSGWGGQTNDLPQGNGGNTSQMFTTPDAVDRTTDGSDFYLTVFSRNLEDPLYASFFGGGTANTPQGEHVDGGTSRFDRKGIVYQSVCGGCGGNSLFPTTSTSHSPANRSQNCNNAVFKLDFENLNRAPEVNDVFYSVVVTNELNFEYRGTDVDRFDSLFFDIDSSAFGAAFIGTKPQITYPAKGLRDVRLNFRWTPGCNQVTGDTIYVKTRLRDQGCPDSKSDSAVIKILVLPMPVFAPPGVLCVVPVSPTSIRIRWEGGDTSNPNFSHFMIEKTDPQGNKTLLGPFKKGEKFEYLDINVSDYRNRNYCYFIYSVNKCDTKGANSYTICTKDQFNAPIKATEIVTATVEDNKNVKLVWRDTKEDDFESYLLYRSPRTTSNTHSSYSFYASTTVSTDTTFIDNAVKVNNQSFCYKIQVSDKCGHISNFSNIGCNIVLRGTSEPYLHKLQWDEYKDWKVGVEQYKMIRKDDRNNPAQIYQGVPAVLNTSDDQLDFDWGGYWYVVEATEKEGNLATSLSNEVYLIQKPLLHVPTAFTPTGDLLNDVWGHADVFVKEYHMQVFNRWGQKVFESFDKNEQWDGSFANKGPADDVFIWLVRYTGWDNSVTIKKGTVTIIN